jgi:hypothetical protein
MLLACKSALIRMASLSRGAVSCKNKKNQLINKYKNRATHGTGVVVRREVIEVQDQEGEGVAQGSDQTPSTHTTWE